VWHPAVADVEPWGGGHVERIGRSWALVKASWAVVRADKELVVFPIVSTLLTLLVVALFAIPVVATGAVDRWANQEWTVVDLVLAFLFYLVMYAVVIFCNAALVGAADIRLKGGDATLGDGFRIALSRLPQILGWAVVSATVGLVLRAIQERGGVVGAVAAAIGGVAWGLITFLVVPILVFEGIGPWAAVKRSGSLLRQTWGEQIVGNAGIGIIFALAGVAVAVVGGGLAALLLAAAFPLGVVVAAVVVVVVVAIALLGTALAGIFTVALYRYATTGQAGAFFPRETLDSAFRPK
jgi:hypothetical protein